ncbi:MAG: hypothetical protein J5527_02420 [Treponema sp.]|nr:hypothetical protein [Treponema sp.]
MVREIKKQASKVFWSALQYKKVPSKEALAVATEKTEAFLQQQILSDSWIKENTRLGIVSNDINKTDKLKNVIKSYLIEEKIQLPIISPVVNTQASILRIAIASGVGSVAGGLLFEAVFEFFHLSSSLGLLVGGAAGAFLFTWLLGLVAKNQKLRRRLLVILGVASFSSFAFSSFVKSLRGKKNLFKKLGLLLAAIFVILFMKSEDKFNKTLYSEYLDSSIDWWLSQVSFAYELTGKMLGDGGIKAHNDQAIAFMVEELGKINKLNSLDDMNREVSFATQYLKRFGIEAGGENKKDKRALIWDNSLIEFYDRYGSIEEGDPFFVESEAIVKDGIVIKKGLVRKNRK